MPKDSILMIPGPTNIHPRVYEAMSKTIISHVSQPFAVLLRQCLEYTQELMGTDDQIYLVAGSGTLAMEMGLINVMEPRDKVLTLCNGHFGERFAHIVERHGGVADRLEIPWGKVVDPNMVRERLEGGQYKAVTAVHVDTSTATANRIAEIGDVVKDFDCLYVVDSVCSLGGMDLRVDDWNIDVCISASQKALAAPPGLAIVSASKQAMEVHSKRQSPVSFFYGDFANWLAKMRDAANYFATLPVNTIYAYHEALRIILEEGLEARFGRHASLAGSFRSSMRELGMRLVADEECAANTLTAVFYPPGVDDAAFRKEMAQGHGVVIAEGLGGLKGKAFRVGHMGNVNAQQIERTVQGIKSSLASQGHQPIVEAPRVPRNRTEVGMVPVR